ncbi:MAG: hypothetical protein FWF09_05565 [Bacteroidales bacterium]|nr:hypothetical protein [Bacteroidales bacterium]
MFLGILFGCLLVALGLFSIPNLFVSSKKEISDFFKKLLPYQGWIGLVVCIVGVMALIQYALKIATDIKPILWLTEMLCCAGLAILGFLLSYNLIYLYLIPKGKKAEETPDKMRTQIMPLQGKIGILCALIGVWSVMAAVMFR